MDWVTTPSLIGARNELIQLYWEFAQKLNETKTIPECKAILTALRMCYRHIEGFTDTILERQTLIERFEPHLYDQQGIPWPKPNKMKGVPPPPNNK